LHTRAPSGLQGSLPTFCRYHRKHRRGMLNPGCRETRYWPAGEHARYLPPAARRCELHLPELHSTPAILEQKGAMACGGVGENREDRK
jgi:hypothetical protein